MITEEKRSVVVRYWFEKAEESMTSARREFEAGSLSFAMKGDVHKKLRNLAGIK
jgi:hypothetical protein